MENLKLIKQALDKATQRGVYTLDETLLINEGIKGLHESLSKLEKLPLAKENGGTGKKDK